MNIEAQVIAVPAGVQDYRPALYGGVSAVELTVTGVRRVGLRVDLDELNRRVVLAYTGASRNSGINNWDVMMRRINGDPAVVAAFNGIRDAAPDGWGRMLMTKAAGDRHMAEFDYLVASSDRRVGALAFGPTPDQPARQTPWGDADAPGEHFDLATLLEASLKAQEVDELDDSLRQLLSAGSSMGGARPKATLLNELADFIA